MTVGSAGVDQAREHHISGRTRTHKLPRVIFLNGGIVPKLNVSAEECKDTMENEEKKKEDHFLFPSQSHFIIVV